MDNKQFGNYVKNIRNNLKLTQSEVSKKIGLSPETLRRIEKGLHNVSIATIELLSDFYKVDLIKIMQMCVNTDSLFSKKLDEVSIFLKKGDLNMFYLGIEKLIEKLESYGDNKHYIDYLKALLMIEVKDIRFGLQVEQNIDVFLNDFSFNQYYITPLEISLNIYCSIVLQLNGQLSNSTKVLQKTYNRVINLPYSMIDKSHSITVIQINLSACYYRQKKYDLALLTINETINNTELQFKIDDLFQLYFRKGLSLYQLNDKQFKPILKTAFNLISTENFLELYILYKNHVLDEYNINIDIL